MTERTFSALMTSRVLVTGGTGFIGRRLSRSLLGVASEVHVVSRRSLPDKEDFQYWQGDVADPEFVRSVWRRARPDVVFHLAGRATGDRRIEQILPTFRAHLQSTINVLVCSTDLGSQRVLLAGSMEEPNVGDPDSIPGSPYAAAKFSSTKYAQMMAALYGTPVLNLRTFMVYGPGQRSWNKLIPYVARSLLLGKAPQISSGQRLIDWIYVDDVVEAYIAAAAASDVVGEILDIGSGHQYTIRETVDSLADLIPSSVEPIFGALEDRPREQIPVADANRTEQRLGWKAKTPLDEGLRRTVEWVREELRVGASEPAGPRPR